jgi:hypothetical protein
MSSKVVQDTLWVSVDLQIKAGRTLLVVAKVVVVVRTKTTEVAEERSNSFVCPKQWSVSRKGYFKKYLAKHSHQTIARFAKLVESSETEGWDSFEQVLGTRMTVSDPAKQI